MLSYDKPVLNKNGEPLKIGMLGQHFCIRVVKRSRALKKVGYTLFGSGNKISYGVNSNLYDNYFYWDNEKGFKNAVRTMINCGVDILDYSNEPNEPVIWAKEVIKDMGVNIPIVLDGHDWDTIRRNIIPIPEREAINAADGIIYVSLSIQELMNKLHSVDKPTITLYSYCNDGIIEYDDSKLQERHGLVYEGGANSPEDNELNVAFAYRSLYNIIKRLVDLGNEVHMFCGNFDAFQNYQNLGAMLYPPTDYDEMMKRMVNFKYGILIFNNKENTENQVRYTTANKLFEYLMCGLPSLACWCEEMMTIIKKHNIGFVFEDVEEIQDTKQLETKYLEIMENIKVKRKELVMENYIVKLENLYAKLLNVPGKQIPQTIKILNEFEYGKEETNKVIEFGNR
jgi:glycosyltransferase involved in cell wall biosynthesis